MDHDDGDGDNGTTSVGDRMLQHFVDAEQQKSGDEQIAYAKLKQLFAPFVLRRKKSDVIAQLLPPKKKIIEYVELDDAGRKIYNSILEEHINKNGPKSTTTTTAAIGEHLFTNLRKAAHHPLLLRTRHNTPSEVDHLVSFFHKYQAFAGEGSTKVKVAEELTKYNDFQIHLTALDLVEENPHRRPDLERVGVIFIGQIYSSPNSAPGFDYNPGTSGSHIFGVDKLLGPVGLLDGAVGLQLPTHGWKLSFGHSTSPD